MKYLTNDEKNVLMFFEETLDAFEEDNEEPPILLNSSLGCYSLRTEDSHSDSDDIIDLVQRGHNHEGLLSGMVLNHRLCKRNVVLRDLGTIVHRHSARSQISDIMRLNLFFLKYLIMFTLQNGCLLHGYTQSCEKNTGFAFAHDWMSDSKGTGQSGGERATQ